MSTHTKRRAILEAANIIVKRDGIARLTIDAVARESGVSKGGVLYHFPSKEALVEGIVTVLLEDFTRDQSEALRDEEPGPGQWLRSYIRASCTTAQEEPDAALGLMVALAAQPQLLASIQQQYAAWQERVEDDGLSPALATILRLAVDGLCFSDWLGLAPPQGALREEVIQLLLTMARSSHHQETR